MINKIKISGYRNFYYEEELKFNDDQKIGAIFGPNGVGKTNLLDAISFIKELALDDRIELNKKDYLSSYDDTEKVATEFIIDFTHMDSRFKWEIHLNNMIVYESLHVYFSVQPSKIYEFDNRSALDQLGSDESYSYTFGKKYNSLKKDIYTRLLGEVSILSQLIKAYDFKTTSNKFNHLHLDNSVNNELNIKINDLPSIIRDSDSVYLPNTFNRYYNTSELKVNRDHKIFTTYSDFLKRLTSNYKDYLERLAVTEPEKPELLFYQASDFFDNKLVIRTHRNNEVNQFLNNLIIEDDAFLMDHKYNELIYWLSKSDFTITGLELKEIPSIDSSPLPFYVAYSKFDEKYYEVYVRHTNRSIKLKDESLGTIKYIELLVAAVSSIRSGSIFIVDEIDGSIFGTLISLIIEEYRNSERSQLIFTSHNLDLLERDLKREEIFFIERDEEDMPALVPLTSINGAHARKNFKKDYSMGRFTKVPMI